MNCNPKRRGTEVRSSNTMGLQSMSSSLLLSSLLITLSSLPLPSHGRDTLMRGDTMKDGETLISAGDVFELGFFSPGRSENRYIGIWYYNFSTDTVLWVANREKPVSDTSGSLTVASDGNLVVTSIANGVLWSSNASLPSNSSPIVQLLDTGNLVVNNSGDIAWQSFDHPTDTYLPGMKIGLDMRTNVNQLFTSWKSADDPAVGNFSMGVDPKRSTQIFLWDNGKPRWRSGRWNAQVFIGVQNMMPQYIYGFKLSDFLQEQKMYFYYSAFNSSHRYVLTWDGVEKHMLWKDDAKYWSMFWAQPVTSCDFYNKCGNYGSCSDESKPICSCLHGFVPTLENEWNRGSWSGGCVRRTPLQCEKNYSSDGKKDGFLKMERVKLPDLSDWYTSVMDPSDCEQTCLSNCSCKAYSYSTGIGCLIWGAELVDIHIFSSGGEDMYLRLAGSELDNKKKITAFVIAVIAVAAVMLLGCIYLSWKCKRRMREFLERRKSLRVEVLGRRTDREETGISGIIEIRGKEKNERSQDFPLWSFNSIVAATDNFSDINLIGEGGFGPVYRGILPEGQEVAVKRLSKTSGQGLEEFKNEIILIAKLQHRNLVRLLGCCINKEEKILIYEYMPNRSLDAFLFGPGKKGLLDWNARYSIVEGIARGLLYLHRDSRLRVIHRDLKASNILLDEEMNPKISDFGMAQVFGKDGNETNSTGIAGTYGYMAPEYVKNGLFSVKSDVYSFGVLLLEIVSGRRNSTFQHPESSLNLLSLAWKLWNEDSVMEFVDPSIVNTCLREEVSRCVNVALLCVQDDPNDRPTMPSVVIMLEAGTLTHPLPKQPTFTAEKSSGDTDSLMFDLRDNSANTSITMITGR